jgi:hypothetical protein
MAFGDRVEPASGIGPAAWIGPARRTSWGTVGALVPNDFDSYLLIEAAPTDGEGWWDAQRAVVAAIASVAARHTSTPARAWFAIWEGHGWDAGEVPATIPRVALPHRTYHLLAGEVDAATAIEEPGTPGRWCPPDLWWPDDRSWFVATDVDFWCNYVAGSQELTAAVAAAVPVPTRPVTLLDPPEVED